MNNFKSGFVAVIGLPNCGKSTFVNAALGQKLSVTNPKPQTTRKKILGILTERNFQIIFVDTPGILKPAYLLQKKMLEYVHDSVTDADLVIIILDPKEDPEGNKTFSMPEVQKCLEDDSKKKIILINKVDLLKQEDVKLRLSLLEKKGKFEKIIPISALLGFNISSVIDTIVELLPNGPKYYPDDIISESDERFFVSEIIREKILDQYREEIPYSVEVLIEEFKERNDARDYIRAVILVEKNTQKGIIIGNGGKAIKKLGLNARKAIEEFLGREVFLELYVKVEKNWRSNEKVLKRLGYTKEQ
ncbi:MAG: GTPase Era [Ignavibacteriaceae bacterium]